MALFRLAHATLELRFEKTYETLSGAVIRSMELLNACYPRDAQALTHVLPVPGSLDLTDPSPSPTPAVNRVSLPSLFDDAFKHPSNFTISVI